MERNYISFSQIQIDVPQAYEALAAQDTCDLTPEEFYEESDCNFYFFTGELYCESHDDQTLSVWRGGDWVVLDFNDRPGIL